MLSTEYNQVYGLYKMKLLRIHWKTSKISPLGRYTYQPCSMV